MSEPESDRQPASPLGILVAYLTGIQTWRRAGIALVLGAGFLSLWLIYQQPQQVYELLNAALRPAPPAELPYMTPFYTDVWRALTHLLAEFKPNMIGVAGFRVDILTNEQRLVAAVTLPEYEPLLATLTESRWKYPQAAFRDDPIVNHILVRLYLGRFVCVPAAHTWSAFKGIAFVQEVCLIAVPPDGIGLAGFIGGAFRDHVPEDRRAGIEAAFRTTAESIVWYRHQHAK